MSITLLTNTLTQSSYEISLKLQFFKLLYDLRGGKKLIDTKNEKVLLEYLGKRT